MLEDGGKFVFPIPEEGISHDDAVYTLICVEAAELHCSGYDETGNEPGSELQILFTDDDNCFSRAKLKQLIIDDTELQDETKIFEQVAFSETNFNETWTEDIAAGHYRIEVLRIMLLRTFAEWERTYRDMTPKELRENPL